MPIPIPRGSIEALEPHDGQNYQYQPEDHGVSIPIPENVVTILPTVNVNGSGKR